MSNCNLGMSLEMECFGDDLSPAQLESFRKMEDESNELQEKLRELILNYDGQNVYSGKYFSVFQLIGKISEADIKSKFNLQPVRTKKRILPRRANKYMTGQKVGRRKASPDTDTEEDKPVIKKAKEKISKSSPIKKNLSKSPEKPKTGVSNLRPSEISSMGGLVVPEDFKSSADFKEKMTNKQGKTFPSLVVVAKPFLKVKETTSSERITLDSKVKVVLMMTPSKFTEWLIQQGLLKAEQKCTIHKNNNLKLGVYSDITKFSYSGGYVWISECCPTRFVSVYYGSLFEGAPNPPPFILKLIYHWSCQTSIQNVVQWVKVDSTYVKAVYTWLRAVCTSAIHRHLPCMGGANKHIEVGVISLGTTTQDGKQRQVKVEILGVLNHDEKFIRLRAIEPFTENERSSRKRFERILAPLEDWVQKDSIITIDLTVDKVTLDDMGFRNVVQIAANEQGSKYTNAHVMDYLRKIVPRMFQNTLSLLSRQMIQQFLDELVWRENFGTHALDAFDNIIKHIAEQTKLLNRKTLIQSLYQVATNPFKNWANIEDPEMELSSDSSEKLSYRRDVRKPTRSTELHK